MSKLKNAMSLKQFMIRQEVLQMYRSYLRLGRLIQGSDEESSKKLQLEWNTWVRSEFDLRKNEKNEDVIRNMLVIGKRQLGELNRSIRISNG
ncbi:unnamed protein product [Allacma fusca]|uniref:Complex 1 LYR protein domain-containing protein n=1 Tax=Allacma fusca TaxID=39272 RepID=A0A8J2LLR3_9HEXA|nr:unnamed protein product [Allacma fusca]